MYEGCPVETSPTMALIPLYGYYSCEPVQFSHTTSDATWYNNGETEGIWPLTIPFWQTNVGCPYDTGYTDQCMVFVQPKVSITGYWYYRICSSSGNCPSWIMMTSLVSGAINQYPIFAGQIFQIKASKSDNIGNIIRVYEKYNAYGLVQYERGSKNLLSNLNCNPPAMTSWVTQLTKPLYDVAEQVMPSSSLPQGSTSTSGALKIMTYRVYLKDWVIGPLRANFFTDPTDNKYVDCSENKLYTLGTVKTELGCGAYPYAFKRNMNCCPGDKDLSGSTCIVDSSHPNGYYPVVTTTPIPCSGPTCNIPSIVSCDGKGGWVEDLSTSTPTYEKATSISSTGVCSYQKITVTCRPPSVGCPSGALCVIDYYNPANNKCVGGIVACGDNNGDCYDDCTYAKINNCVPKGGEIPPSAGSCYSACDLQKNIADITGVSTYPCKISCWLNSKMTNIIIGILASIFVALAIFVLTKGAGWMFSLIGAVIIFIATILNLWIGIIVLIIAIVGAIIGWLI